MIGSIEEQDYRDLITAEPCWNNEDQPIRVLSTQTISGSWKMDLTQAFNKLTQGV